MCAVISTNDGKQYQTPGFWPQAGAVIVGSMAGNMVNSVPKGIAPQIMNSMKDLNKGVDTVVLKEGVEKALDISGVKAKGVELIDVKSSGSGWKIPFSFKFPTLNKPATQAIADTAEEASKVVIKDYKLKKAILTELPAKLRGTKLGKLYTSMISNMLKEGDNACFLPKANKCVVNMEKIGTSAFHEIGHSINRNMSTFWKAMQKMRTPAMLTAGVIPLVGLFKRKKVEGEEPKNAVDKVTTFIKEHCGKLTTLAFVPVVAEELKASQRGNKLAKQLLSPEMYKKVVKSNKLGAASYVLAAGAAGLTAFVGSTVRDALSKPKEIK